jgi:hypothetical protein
MLRGAAGIGAAGLAAGVFAGAVAGPASAATTASATDDTAVDTKPLTVHIHDARTGVMDVFSGEQHVRFTDRQLAARLARAAR